jgi:hypothetical protein
VTGVGVKVGPGVAVGDEVTVGAGLAVIVGPDKATTGAAVGVGPAQPLIMNHKLMKNTGCSLAIIIANSPFLTVGKAAA